MCIFHSMLCVRCLCVCIHDSSTYVGEYVSFSFRIFFYFSLSIQLVAIWCRCWKNIPYTATDICNIFLYSEKVNEFLDDLAGEYRTTMGKCVCCFSSSIVYVSSSFISIENQKSSNVCVKNMVVFLCQRQCLPTLLTLLLPLSLSLPDYL